MKRKNIFGIILACSLKGRVHRQLRQTDIHGVHGQVGVCDVAQCAAAKQIGTVGEVLDGNAGFLAQSGKHGLSGTVGGIAGAVLDNHASVHDGTMGGVGILGMVGVNRVGIIGADKEAVGNGGAFVAT